MWEREVNTKRETDTEIKKGSEAKRSEAGTIDEVNSVRGEWKDKRRSTFDKRRRNY